MKWSFTFAALFFLSFAATKAHAQLSCEYVLELYDTFGDGWNGSTLTVNVGGTPTVYTLNNIADNGEFRSFNLQVTDGATITLTYAPGFFENEVSYILYNSDGNVVFEDGPFPGVGLVFTGTITCPSCPAPSLSSLNMTNIRAFNARFNWTPSDPAGVYLIEYDTLGFTLGEGNVVLATGNTRNLTGLSEDTDYEVYITVACANGDTSNVVGPVSFRTLWANDVGVIDVIGAAAQCGLGVEAISVTLQNFGGLPQSLIPFNFSVNGMPGGVNQPLDGFFTGVLGTGSTFDIPFETTYDFSEPGEYLIAAWTDLANDSNRVNDTAFLTVTNIPIISEFPYFTDFEEWNSGWTVDENSQNATWAYGTPAGAVINGAASGQFAWVTNLTGNYNNNENSFLVSPCLDFSSLTEDPQIAFSLFFVSEACCDEAWLDVSLDDGETWTKVGTSGTGINWYNDAFNQWWDGTGGFNGWVTARNVLAGTAGESQVRLRFAFSTDASVVREGVGIDDVFISPPLQVDLLANAGSRVSTEPCGSATEAFRFTIANFGASVQTGFDVSYQVNGGDIVTENVGTLSIDPGQQAPYTFMTAFNSTAPAVYNVKMWVSALGEQFAANDTTFFSFASAASLPYAENFELGVLPPNWTVTPGVQVTQFHGNTSFVLSRNVWTAAQNFSAATPAIGVIAAGDTLAFDYRVVDFSGNGPTVWAGADSVQVRISTDCGMTYTSVLVINNTNHTPTAEMTRIFIPLDDYIGEAIRIQFRAGWTAGDYWVDIDNINIKRCPATLGIAVTAQDASAAGMADGSLSVQPSAGIGPYTYLWSNGTFDRTATDLAPGTYSVAVFDAQGCVEVLEDLVVGVLVSASDIAARIGDISLAPNPTQGTTQLLVNFATPSDADLRVVNMLGQTVYQATERQVLQLSHQLELQRQPAGIYLVRVMVGQELKTAKLIKVD